MISIPGFDNGGEFNLLFLQNATDIDSEAFHTIINSGERMVIILSDMTINSTDFQTLLKLLEREGSYFSANKRDEHMLTVVCPAKIKEKYLSLIKMDVS